MAALTIRSAHERDLPAVYAVRLANELGGQPPSPLPPMAPDLPHELATGEMFVAERAGQLVGFAGVIVRGDVAFLGDLFVLPDQQSSGVGRALLQHAFERHQERVRCTVSSTDLRALGLYIRSGMRPWWPNILLRADTVLRHQLARDALDVVLADPADQELVRWDAAIAGRERPQDHAYWLAHEGAVPLWVCRAGERIGYGYVRLKAGTLWRSEAARLGPVGVSAAVDAAAGVAACVRWAAEQASVLLVDVPGPHAALPMLLEAGFTITYVETFVSSAEQPFFDPACYVGSGGALL